MWRKPLACRRSEALLPLFKMGRLFLSRLLACVLLLTSLHPAMAETANELLDQALAAGNAGRFDEAAAKFTELIARSPKVPDLSLWYMERADAYVHGGHYDLAWADLAQAIALDPKHAKEHYLQGFILDERHQLQPGIEAYSKAIAI